MLRNGVKSDIKRFSNVQESSWPVCQPPDNRAPSRVRNGAQNVCQWLHGLHYTIRCNEMQALSIGGSASAGAPKTPPWEDCVPFLLSLIHISEPTRQAEKS